MIHKIILRSSLAYCHARFRNFRKSFSTFLDYPLIILSEYSDFSGCELHKCTPCLLQAYFWHSFPMVLWCSGNTRWVVSCRVHIFWGSILKTSTFSLSSNYNVTNILDNRSTCHWGTRDYPTIISDNPDTFASIVYRLSQATVYTTYLAC